jgi:hypothetical protein
MTTQKQLDEKISKWLEAEAPSQLPDHVLRTTFERTRKSRQHGGWRALLGRTDMNRFAFRLGSAAVVVLVAGLALSLWPDLPGIGGPPPLLSATPTATAPPSGEPTPASTPTFVVARPQDGTPLGWSRDGTRLLIQKGRENLFILHADGSETQVTEQLSGITRFPGSGRPAGATISPDGSRVVFAGLTKTPEEARFCHDGALFAVDADGGPADVLWKSQVPQNGIVRYPSFSPDGTQIAFVDGYCDSDHSVWVMNADGSDAHQIVSIDQAGHVYGLAWSAAGDRIALSCDCGSFTFATDGSDFTRFSDASEFCWPGRRC